MGAIKALLPDGCESNNLASQDSQCGVWYFFFFSSRRRHTRFDCDWSSDVSSSDLELASRVAGDSLREHGVCRFVGYEEGVDEFRQRAEQVAELLRQRLGETRNLFTQIGRASCRERV